MGMFFNLHVHVNTLNFSYGFSSLLLPVLTLCVVVYAFVHQHMVRHGEMHYSGVTIRKMMRNWKKYSNMPSTMVVDSSIQLSFTGLGVVKS